MRHLRSRKPVRPADILLYLLVLLSPGLTAQPGNPVFISGDDGYACFRIPAIVKVDNRLTAFAEGRRNGCSDTGDIDLVMKYSDDQGLTWSPLKVIVHREGYTSGNPAPVMDDRSGTIHLLFTSNLGEDHEWQIINGESKDTRRVFHMSSGDRGYSWTEPREITNSVKKDNWTWYATGPGSGIRLTSPAFDGRLMLACDHIEQGSQKYFSHVVFSDDAGKSWQLGGSTPTDQVNECEVAELDGGILMLNMRNYDRVQRTRKVSFSQDGGASWSIPESDPVLVEPICQASLHRHDGSSGSLLLFSNPASDSARINMTLRWSDDMGKTWTGSRQVHGGPSAYSDLVTIEEGTAGILYEGGLQIPYEGIFFERISLRDF